MGDDEMRLISLNCSDYIKVRNDSLVLRTGLRGKGVCGSEVLRP